MSDNDRSTGYEAEHVLTRRTALKSGLTTVALYSVGVSGGDSAGVGNVSATPTSGPIPTVQQARLTDEGFTNQFFGGSVALDGDTALIGAYGESYGLSMSAGEALVFTRSDGNWTEQQRFRSGEDSDSEGFENFGVSVALDGDTALVGSDNDDDVGSDDQGATFVFTRSGGSWSQQTKLSAKDGDADDAFGVSVALDGDTALVGASGDEDPNGKSAGSAYVFTRAGGSWTQQAKLSASDGDAGDGFGGAVALDGDTALVGAILDEDPNGKSAGSAYVFTRSSGSWTQQAKLSAKDGDEKDLFGGSVALDGGVALVGADFADSANTDFTGAAYVFTGSGANWTEEEKLTADDGKGGDEFGIATALDGGTAVIGARADDSDDENEGSAYVFVPPNDSPTASFTVSPSEPDEGESATFDASGSSDSDGSIRTYEWDWDDDGTFEERTSSATTTHTYATGGDKTVTLRVTDDDGATATTSQTFHVNEIPAASFTVSPDPVVRNEQATFDASGSSDPDGSIRTYEWDWDDDGTYEESTSSATITHTFATGGERTVTLRVTDDDGATSDPVTTTVTVHIRADVDVKPGGGSNPINPDSRGTVPVAVLQTSAFDPSARLDPATVHFGDPDDVGFDSSDTPEGGATPAHEGGHVEDVDSDGDDDYVFHFPIRDAGFDSRDSEAELVGLTNGGVPVFGTDSVTLVGR